MKMAFMKVWPVWIFLIPNLNQIQLYAAVFFFHHRLTMADLFDNVPVWCRLVQILVASLEIRLEIRHLFNGRMCRSDSGMEGI